MNNTDPQSAVARDKRAKFVELANRRVNRALKDLALIGNLANKKNYDYSDEQAKKIIRALQAGVDQLKSDFSAESSEKHSEFQL